MSKATPKTPYEIVKGHIQTLITSDNLRQPVILGSPDQGMWFSTEDAISKSAFVVNEHATFELNVTNPFGVGFYQTESGLYVPNSHPDLPTDEAMAQIQKKANENRNITEFRTPQHVNTIIDSAYRIFATKHKSAMTEIENRDKRDVKKHSTRTASGFFENGLYFLKTALFPNYESGLKLRASSKFLFNATIANYGIHRCEIAKKALLGAEDHFKNGTHQEAFDAAWNTYDTICTFLRVIKPQYENLAREFDAPEEDMAIISDSLDTLLDKF